MTVLKIFLIIVSHNFQKKKFREIATSFTHTFFIALFSVLEHCSADDIPSEPDHILDAIAAYDTGDESDWDNSPRMPQSKVLFIYLFFKLLHYGLKSEKNVQFWIKSMFF